MRLRGIKKSGCYDKGSGAGHRNASKTIRVRFNS